jgi:hypothetical protein
MSALNKEDYYSTNQELNNDIDNVLSIKKYIDNILEEVKVGKYDIKVLHKLSDIAFNFFNELEDSDEHKFNPRSNIVDFKSDDSESLNEELDEELNEELDEKVDDNKEKNYSNLSTELSLNDSDDILGRMANDYNPTFPPPQKYTAEYYDTLQKMFTRERVSNHDQHPYDFSQFNSPNVPKKDKLADEFLNNNLELGNYYYLKSFDTTRVNNYIDQCYYY